MKSILIFAALLLGTFAATAGTFSLTGLTATPMANGKVQYSLGYTNVDGSASASINMALMQGNTIVDEVSMSGVMNGGIVDTAFTAPSSGSYYVIAWGFDNEGNAAFSDTMWIVVTIQTNTAVQNISFTGSNPVGNCRIISLSGNVVGEYSNAYLADAKKNFLHDFRFGIYLFEFISEDRTLVVRDKVSVQ